ncbi:MAG TPA: hypothetical protein VJ957_12445 [Longimicrobiales bacterium]|nr:hypothetical protein [Longimicrobiales bacterium]
MVLTVGFTYEPEVYDLTFTATRLEGLEVSASSVPIEALLRFAVLEEAARADGVTAADLQANTAERIAIFAAALRSWNLTDSKGKPVPTTAAAIASQDPMLAMGVMAKWWVALNEVPDPLPNGSRSTGSSGLEPSIPMEPLSPNPVS